MRLGTWGMDIYRDSSSLGGTTDVGSMRTQQSYRFRNEIIEKPMDFGTIRKKMEAKAGTEYKHVRQIYADVRLVFSNAMKYNDEKNKFQVMAETLLEKFEEKWRQFLPLVTEEDRRRGEEETELQLNAQVAQEAAYAEIARTLGNEVSLGQYRFSFF